MKRSREELEAGDGDAEGEQQAAAAEPAAAAAGGGGGDAQQQQLEQAGGGAAAAADEEDGGDSEDDKPLFSNYKMSRSVRKGAECPYLDTISRQVGGRRGLRGQPCERVWDAVSSAQQCCPAGCTIGPGVGAFSW